MSKKTLAIIGGGPASMMLACSLDKSKYEVFIYEQNGALGRKFLVAGKGGFNLTHSENLEDFVNRYYPKEFIKPFLHCFSNSDLIVWLKSIGIDTYVGTSKRVFPVKGIKPIEVLKVIEKEIIKNSAHIFYNYKWNGWVNNQLAFLNINESKCVSADIVVFALGGASWKVTGSDGSWDTYFKEKGIQVNSFYPSNCAYKIDWEAGFSKLIEGQVLKNCEFRCGSIIKKGEAVLTQFGIEGSGIYALSKSIRDQLISDKKAELTIDFKPELCVEEIIQLLKYKGNASVKDVLKQKLNLSDTHIRLLKYATTKEEYANPGVLCKHIKQYTLIITDFAPLDGAISTVGGIALNEISSGLEFKKLPRHYSMGEMLDWDAPTGGYLLQACFSMGKFLASELNKDAV